MICLMGLAGKVRGEAPRTIVFFGDSLTAGYGLDDPSTEAFPAYIEEKIDKTVHIGVTLRLPNPTGPAALTISDGASLRNATLVN